MIKTALILIVFSLSAVVHGADLKGVLAKMKENQKSNLSYSMTYQLFKGHKSAMLHSSYDGEVYSFDGNSYKRINHTEMISTNEFNVKIDKDEKVMVLSATAILEQEVDVDQALKECSKSVLIEKDDYYHLVFRFNTTSSIPCTAIKIRVDKKTYQVLQLDLFYSTFQDFSTNWKKQDLHQAHLKILFSNIKVSPKEHPEVFKQSTYLSVTNSILSPNGDYKGYELIDNRIQ